MGQAGDPAWAPFGSLIAFTGEWHIWIVPSIGGVETQLTFGSCMDTGAAYSPDGGEIAFCSDRSGNWDIWIYRTIGENDNTTLVLHAVDDPAPSCDETGGLDCGAVRPTVDITGFATPTVFLLVRNYDDVMGAQAAFRVPASWAFASGRWDCQPSQVVGIAPEPPWGPESGTIAAVFDLLTGGQLAVIGSLSFSSAGDGCMEIIDSCFPYGTHVINRTGEIAPVIEPNRGRVCVGGGGHDACFPVAPVAIGEGDRIVEPTTWGAIKSRYYR